MRSAFAEALPIWRRVRGLLEEGKSVVLSTSRYQGAHEFVTSVGSSYASSTGADYCEVSINAVSLDDSRDYWNLWAPIGQRRGLHRKKIPLDIAQLETALRATLKRRDRPLFLVVIGDAEQVDALYEVLGILHVLANEHPFHENGGLKVLALDNDLALLLRERGQSTLESEWYLFEQVLFSPMLPSEMRECVQSLVPKELTSERVQAIADAVYELSDGHIGLTRDILRRVELESWHVADAKWRVIKEQLSASDVLEKLRHALQEDPRGLAQTAVEFRAPGYPVEYNSPRMQLLRRLGVLRWITGASVVLMGGLIGSMVGGIAEAPLRTRIGTAITPAGLWEFKPEELELQDNDLVVVHISDLHVGAEHAFRLVWEGGSHEASAQGLCELLLRDLHSLGVATKVNAVVVSGDLVCSGTSYEYQRAAELLTGLLESLGLGNESLILVPGNHDIDWAPSSFAKHDRGRSESREAFDEFAKSFGKNITDGVYMTAITSRDGKRRLRILALDSTAVESKEAAGIGYIDSEALKRADDLIKRDSTTGVSETYTWCAVHHHVFPVTSATVSEARQRHVSVMANAPELLAYASKWRAEAILHGHQHQPSVIRAQRWSFDRPEDLVPLVALGAGSIGAVRTRLGPVARNHYFVIIRRPSEMIVRSRFMGVDGIAFVTQSDLIVR